MPPPKILAIDKDFHTQNGVAAVVLEEEETLAGELWKHAVVLDDEEEESWQAQSLVAAYLKVEVCGQGKDVVGRSGIFVERRRMNICQKGRAFRTHFLRSSS